jgi:hypothetical protein
VTFLPPTESYVYPVANEHARLSKKRSRGPQLALWSRWIHSIQRAITVPYFPPPFSVDEAVICGKLIDQAYQQFTIAKAANPSRWTIQDGYTLETQFCATENFVPLPIEIPSLKPAPNPLPFGFIASKENATYVVIRGTQTPLEWFDDASIQPMPFNAGWGNTTVGFMSIHRQIFPEIHKFFFQRAKPLD